MSKDVLDKKSAKFLFDVHVFDEDGADARQVEEAPPPPPTFSEAELEQARKQAFEQGKQQGLKDSAASRDQQIAAILGVVSHHLSDLLEQERRREKTYETEAVSLSLKIFQRLFPFFHARNGFEELKTTISSVLQKQEGQKQIHIHVPADLQGGVAAHIDGLKRTGLELNVEVVGDDALPPNACKMTWADGGAVKDAQGLAAEIGAMLEETLAAAGVKGHDSETDTNPSESDMINDANSGDTA